MQKRRSYNATDNNDRDIKYRTLHFKEISLFKKTNKLLSALNMGLKQIE